MWWCMKVMGWYGKHLMYQLLRVVLARRLAYVRFLFPFFIPKFGKGAINYQLLKFHEQLQEKKLNKFGPHCAQ